MNFLNKISISFKRNQAFTHTISGVITISDRQIDGTTSVQEDFTSSLEIWNIKQYKEQWRLAFERLATHENSCLVANVSSNKTVTMWSLYKKEDRVFIYSSTVSSSTNEAINDIWPLTPENSFELIGDKEQFSKEVSCWKVTL